MKKYLLLALSMLVSAAISAEDTKTDLKELAQKYFDTMVATQAPGASEQDIENHLRLLSDDVGHSHLPWVTDDSRLPDGKAAMKKGMMFYIGSHTDYNAELLDVFVFNHSAIAIRYKNYAKGIHPQNNQPIEYTHRMMEVLEIENGKIVVIRKYHE